VRTFLSFLSVPRKSSTFMNVVRDVLSIFYGILAVIFFQIVSFSINYKVSKIVIFLITAYQLHKTLTLVSCVENVDQVDESYMKVILPQNDSKPLSFACSKNVMNSVIIKTFLVVVICRRLSRNYNVDWALASGHADKLDVCLMGPLLTLMQVLV